MDPTAFVSKASDMWLKCIHLCSRSIVMQLYMLKTSAIDNILKTNMTNMVLTNVA